MSRKCLPARACQNQSKANAAGITSPMFPIAAASCERVMRAMIDTSAERSGWPARLAQGCSQGRGGHRWLLGGQREAEELHREEAQRIVGGGEHPLHERSKVRRADDEFERGGARGEHASAARRKKHLEVLAGRGRDVVLAGVPCALDDLARQQMQIAANDVADTPVAKPETYQLGEQRRRSSSAIQRRCQARADESAERAESGSSDQLDAVHHVDADAVLLEVVDHCLGHPPALRDERMTVVHAELDVAAASNRVEQGVHRAWQPKERVPASRTAGLRARMTSESPTAEMRVAKSAHASWR